MKVQRLFFLLLSIFFVLSAVAQTQIKLELTSNSNFNGVQLYSYYPITKGNPPVVVEKLNNGVSTLEIDKNLPKGIYSLYISDKGNLNNAPWIDIYIDPAIDTSMVITWDVKSGEQSVKGTKDNEGYHTLKTKHEKLSHSRQQLENFQKSFDYPVPSLQKELTATNQLLNEELENNLKSNNSEQQPWGSYFKIIQKYTENPPPFETYWDEFPIADYGIYHSPAINNILNGYYQKLQEKYPGEIQIQNTKLIEVLNDKIAKSKEGYRFFRDWLYSWFDFNNAKGTNPQKTDRLAHRQKRLFVKFFK